VGEAAKARLLEIAATSFARRLCSRINTGIGQG